MWMELLKIFSGNDPLGKLGEDFLEMLRLTHKMADIVAPHVFENSLSLDERSQVYELDVQVNKLERAIRKRVVAHLSTKNTQIVDSLLLLMLSKDAERIGDYIKNISEIGQLGGGPIPEGVLRAELAEIMRTAMEIFDAAPEVIETQDRERATVMLQVGRQSAKRADQLLVELAKSDLTPPEVTSMVLLTRFYKRVGAHLVNILSSVVMPLHKVDFYDEKEFRGGAGR